MTLNHEGICLPRQKIFWAFRLCTVCWWLYTVLSCCFCPAMCAGGTREAQLTNSILSSANNHCTGPTRQQQHFRHFYNDNKIEESRRVNWRFSSQSVTAKRCSHSNLWFRRRRRPDHPTPGHQANELSAPDRRQRWYVNCLTLMSNRQMMATYQQIEIRWMADGVTNICQNLSVCPPPAHSTTSS